MERQSLYWDEALVSSWMGSKPQRNNSLVTRDRNPNSHSNHLIAIIMTICCVLSTGKLIVAWWGYNLHRSSLLIQVMAWYRAISCINAAASWDMDTSKWIFNEYIHDFRHKIQVIFSVFKMECYMCRTQWVNPDFRLLPLPHSPDILSWLYPWWQHSGGDDNPHEQRE